jgi:hypothetical protein
VDVAAKRADAGEGDLYPENGDEIYHGLHRCHG